jgi:dehydrogenase/reductase SDR family member 1
LGEAGATIYLTGRTPEAGNPEFIGRTVAALATNPDLMQKSGQVHVAAALALEYGFTDVDGKQPRPITLEEA